MLLFFGSAEYYAGDSRFAHSAADLSRVHGRRLSPERAIHLSAGVRGLPRMRAAARPGRAVRSIEIATPLRAAKCGSRRFDSQAAAEWGKIRAVRALPGSVARKKRFELRRVRLIPLRFAGGHAGV